MIEINPKPNKNLNFLWDTLHRKLTDKSSIAWALLEGSSRSGKTWAILTFLICLCLRPDLIEKKQISVKCYRNDGTTCRDTIVKDFIEIMNNIFGGENDKGEWVSLFAKAGRFNQTTMEYTFTNGSTLSFHGAQNPQKIQGKKATISWLNEAMEIQYDSQVQISIRTEFLMIADWNPSETDHWLFDKIMKNDAIYAYCHSTFHDNIENLTPQIIAEIKKFEPTDENIRLGTADRQKWLVYGEGKRGIRENLIFERWRWSVIDDAQFPDQRVCQRYGIGFDFGHSVDPTAVVLCALCNDCIYIKQLIYERGLTAGRSYDNPDYPSIVGHLSDLNIDKSIRIHADKSASEPITQIRLAGFNIAGTDKPKGSILAGIDILKQFRICICRSSIETQKEFENYSYIKKSNGEITADPEDKNNHAIDAIRYWALDELQSFGTERKLGGYKPISRSSNDFGGW
jgi:phage terminase large subunit